MSAGYSKKNFVPKIRN